MTTAKIDPAIVADIMRRPLERIITMGITGSGKSYQWLKMARTLLPTGAKFRAIDTDNDILYMMYTNFPDLLPENGGNVYVFPAYDWTEYEKSIKWVQQRGLTPEQEKSLDKYLLSAYRTPIKPLDWVILDKSNNAWSTVQNYFTDEVFGKDSGEYFLEVRKKLHEANDVGKSGKKATSIILEGLDGWKDWAVINKLYDDFMGPIIYRVHCHVYTTADVVDLQRNEKDPGLVNLYGHIKVKPAGQKKIGGQMHTIMLLLPGTDIWQITTVKDRAGRTYFKNVNLSDFYRQYMVMKAGWPLIM